MLGPKQVIRIFLAWPGSNIRVDLVAEFSRLMLATCAGKWTEIFVFLILNLNVTLRGGHKRPNAFLAHSYTIKVFYPICFPHYRSILPKLGPIFEENRPPLKCNWQLDRRGGSTTAIRALYHCGCPDYTPKYRAIPQ